MSQAELFDAPAPAALPDNPLGLSAGEAAAFFELSADAFTAALYARMSDLPVGEEIGRFIGKVSAAKDRAAAAHAAFDRSDPDTAAVLDAARRVWVEIHRVTGFLRFAPAEDGVYTALCAPDYYILPALAEHFTLRFGEMPWAIIDEKRGLCLYRKSGGKARIEALAAGTDAKSGAKDPWEDLWRLYHRSINNESRKNPRLQRQFLPERHRKYMIEL